MYIRFSLINKVLTETINEAVAAIYPDAEANNSSDIKLAPA